MFIKCVCYLPTQNKSTSEMKGECEPEVPPNRNSTESCDTGYNSSPSYHQRTDTGKLYYNDSQEITLACIGGAGYCNFHDCHGPWSDFQTG